MLMTTYLLCLLKDIDKKHNVGLPIGSHRQNKWDTVLPSVQTIQLRNRVK